MSLVEDYLAVLCRMPGETNEEALIRFHTYYQRAPAGDAEAGFEFLEQQAFRGISVTPRVLLAATGIEVSQEGLTPESTQFFFEKFVKEDERKRVLLAGQQLLKIADGQPGSIDDVMAAVNVSDVNKQTALTMSDQTAIGLKLYRERVTALAEGKPRVAFPWPKLNEWVPFIYDDDMILLTGKSKTGKSSAAHQIAMYNASRIPVLYFHNEDNQLKLFLRRTAQSQLGLDPELRGPALASTLSYRDLLSHNVKSDAFMSQIERNSQDLLNHMHDNITYVYCSGWTAEQIIHEWRRIKSVQPLGLVIIDYLNKIESYAKIGKIGTMAGAMEYNVELFKREAGRKGQMTTCVLVQQENESGTTRDTRSSYIKSQVHVSFTRDTNENGMRLQGSIAILRANDGMTGRIEARFMPEYMIWIA